MPNHIKTSRPSWRASALVAPLGALTCTLALGLSAPLAHAEALPSFLTSFTGESTPAGSFEDVSGVAVNEFTGDVYVVDTGHDAVDEFSESGQYLAQLTGETRAFAAPSAVTVDNSMTDGHQGYVYVADRGNNAVDIFDSTGAYRGQLAGETTTFSEPAGVAVDGTGAVYVVNAGETVDEFSSDGAFRNKWNDGFGSGSSAIGVNLAGTLVYTAADSGKVRRFKAGGTEEQELLGSGEGGDVAVAPVTGDLYFSEGTRVVVYESEPFTEIGRFGDHGEIGSGNGVTVNDSDHDAYVTDNRAESRVDVFGAAPACRTEAPATLVSSTSFSAPGTVEPIGTPTSYHFQYGLTTAYETETVPVGPLSSTSAVTVALTGLDQPHQTYHYQLVIEFGSSKVACEPDETLLTPSAPPAVDAQSVGTVGQTAAALEAEINPNNEAARYYFESSTSPSLSGFVTDTPAPPGGEIPSTYGDSAVTQEVSGLQPDTTYYYRVIAENEAAANGGATSQSQGPIQSFLTYPSTPTTGTTSGLTQHTATLTGSFTPGGHATRYYFEYSSIRGGGTTPIVDAGSGTSPIAVEANLSDLTPLTAYHYRLIVANGGGLSVGATGEFVTQPEPPNVTTSSSTSVTATSATLTGSLNPEGADSSYRFQYGPTTAFGAETMAIPVEVISLEGRQYASAEVAGLQPDTLYHYRLLVTNGGGTGVGEDRTFTTNGDGQSNPGELTPGFSLTETAAVTSATASYVSLAGLQPLAPAISPQTSAPKLSCKQKAKWITRLKKRRAALQRCAKAKPT
jgi:hypothetical protein